MAGDKTYITDDQGKLHRATRVHAVSPTDIVWSSNPNDYSVQVKIDGKWHRAILTMDAGASEFFENINIDKALVVGGDGKKHTALIVKPESTVTLSDIKTDEHALVSGTTTGETAVVTYSENWSDIKYQDNVNIYKVLVTGSDGKIHTALLTTSSGGGVETIVLGPSPLSLPDAVASSLDYVKAFGGTEQRNLPAGYTQVEYLESTGTQYIDTGAVLKSEATITMVAQASSVATGGPYAFWGLMGSGTFPRWGWSVYSTAWLTDLNQTNTASTANTEKHTFVNSCFYTGTDLYYNSFVDGTALFTNARTVSQVETYTGNTLSAYLFARNNEGTAGNFLACKIFSFEVVQDGVKILSVVPARRNSDNVLGMYDTVSGQFLTNAGTGTFTAGADVVPTPDTPVDIVSNNGVLRYGQYGKNLLDNNTKRVLSATQWRYMDTPATGGGFVLKKGVTYTLSATEPVSVYFYDYDAGTSVKSGLQTCTYTPTEDIRVFFLVYQSPSLPDNVLVQLEIGSTATEYEPYHFGLHTDGTVETINVHGKNLLSPTMIHQGTINGATGEILNAPNRCYTDAIKFKTGDNICIAVDADTPPLYNSAFLYRDADGLNFIRSLSAASTITADNRTGYGFVVPYDCYVRFLFLQPTNFTPADVTNPQLELGSTATAYEPYYNGGTATAEMLLKVGDYTDEQEILSGAVTRKVGVLVLDGTESWAKTGDTYGFALSQATYGYVVGAPVICNQYPYSATVSSNLKNVIANTSGAYALRILTDDTVIDTSSTQTEQVAQFKQFLANKYAAGTPVIVVYPLETPTTESVAGQALQVQAGDNVVEITQASIDGLELEAQYKKSA